MKNQITKPIIVVGAPRSGTTMLAETILAHHPDIAYWGEPNHVWSFGNTYRRHDILTERDVTLKIRSFISEQFRAFLQEHGKARFMEKTPKNCLRLPFILEIFPDAKILHIIRDGRDAAKSASIEWLGGAPLLKGENNVTIKGRFKNAKQNIFEFISGTHRFRKGTWRFREIPAYLPGLGRLVARKIFPNRPFLWGAKFPGIREAHRTYSLLETCAIQWDWCVRSALGYGRNLPNSQYMEIKYEDFLSNPINNLNKILKFLELPYDDALRQHTIKSIHPGNATKWPTTYTKEELEKVMSYIEPTLRYLGYDCSSTLLIQHPEVNGNSKNKVGF